MNKNEKKKIKELLNGLRDLKWDYTDNPHDSTIEQKYKEQHKELSHIVWKDATKRGLEGIGGVMVGLLGSCWMATNDANPETAEYMAQWSLMLGGGAVCLKGLYGLLKTNFMFYKHFYKLYKEKLL